MVKVRLSLCKIIQISVEAYYGVEVYLHELFTTALDENLPLTSDPDSYFPT